MATTVNRNNKYSLIAALIVCALLAYILNSLYPLFMEDWEYSFVWNTERDNLNLVGSFTDIIQSQYAHYMNWGGRAVAHTLAQFLLWIGEGWHDVLNALAFTVFCYMLYRFANGQNKTQTSIFVLVCLLTFFLQPVLYIDILWLTYSCNYLWTTLIIVLFIYPYFLYYLKHKTADGVFPCLGMLSLGILVGWTNENMGCAVVFFLLAIMLLMYKKEKVKIPKWAISGLIGVMVGFAFLVLAPGNFVRLDGMSDGASIIDRFSIEGLKVILMGQAKGFFWALLLPTILFVTLLYCHGKYGEIDKKKQIRTIAILFYLTAVVGLLAFIPVQGGVKRHAYFGITTFAIIAISILYANIDWRKRTKINIGIVSVLFALFCVKYSFDVVYYSGVREFWKEREVLIEQEKDKGKQDIIFTDIIPIRYEYGVYDLYDDKDDWANKMYARYYGLQSVTGKNKLFEE